MSRRVKLPGASELFRPTGTETAVPPSSRTDGDGTSDRAPDRRPAVPRPTEQGDAGSPAGGGSGRVRHEEKITVYVSAEELLALERARLALRAQYGMAIDRGRIVREAIAAMLADLEASADDSELVRRLSTS